MHKRFAPGRRCVSFQNREIITSSGTWTAPDGVLKLRAILVNGGSGGGTGTDGSWDEAGTDGTDGQGGLVWAGTITINPNQVFNVEIGQGGAPGESGGITKFGSYSAADGQNFDPNYTDIASGMPLQETGFNFRLQIQETVEKVAPGA